MTRLVSHRTRFLVALALLTVAPLPFMSACADHAVAPTTPPDTTSNPPDGTKAGRIVGVVEVTLSGIGSGAMQASARSVALAPAQPVTPGAPSSGVHFALSRPTGSGGDGSIQLEPVAVGSFTDGARGNGSERYVYATFKVRNAQDDGTPYTDARTNLTFLPVSTTGAITTIDGTAIASMDRFDSSAASSAIAAQIMPTGHVVRDGEGRIEPDGADVLQVFTESDVAAITPPAGVTSVFPYGFVVHNPSDPTSRTLPANPATTQFDGVVTFAFKVPLQASPTDDPFTISAMFLAADDDQTRLTQSVEEQTRNGAAAVDARAAALGVDSLTLLPGGAAFLGNETERLVCAVRTAGTAGSPTATLALPSGAEPWLLPSPWSADAQRLPRTVQLAAARCPSITAADPSSFRVHGFQSGRVVDLYTGVGTPLVYAPAAAGAGFFPGEEVEVTLTTALGGTQPVVARYRVAATGGSAIFDSVSAPAVGLTPFSVAVADFDGDGDLDLATANDNASSVTVLQNDGSGAFTTLGTPGVGAGPFSITVADLDGDGDIDLATANSADNTVSILQNDGSGVFIALPDPPSVGAFPAFVTAADLDGDGDLDLAVSNSSDNTISILQNSGSGTFSSVGTPSVGTAPRASAAADLDGDGDLDLAVVDFSAGTVSILQNDGSGAFTLLPDPPSVGSGPVSLAAADLDGDGDVDLATANEAGTVSVLQNDGSGTFSTLGTPSAGLLAASVAAADLDGDGDIDLAVANNGDATVSILLNDGNGTFTSVGTPSVGSAPLFLAAADLDGDGDLDLAVVDRADNIVSILQNQ